MLSNKNKISDFAAVVGLFSDQKRIKNTSIYLEITAAKFALLTTLVDEMKNSNFISNADRYFRNLCLFDSELGDTEDLLGELPDTDLAPIPSIMTRNLRNIWKSDQKLKWKIELIKENEQVFLKFIGENRTKLTKLTTEKFPVSDFDPNALYQQFSLQFEVKPMPCCSPCAAQKSLNPRY